MYSARLSWAHLSRTRTLLSMLKPEMLARPESCRQEVPGEVFVQELLVHQELDHPTAQDFDHRL
jgi:hypothetical protein